jgi:predicted ATPase/DNA-binding SARP family transcriptional activator
MSRIEVGVHAAYAAGAVGVVNAVKGGRDMEFRILGPLEVVSDDGPIDVPRAKARALLGLLLVHANRVVARDRLVEELWEGSPPVSAVATLQSYVYQLRQTLGTESLRTRGGGYVLEVKDNDLDALRFESVVGEVSRVEDASPRWVSLRLGEALAWWRGPALADFAGAAWARTEAERLEELRLGVVEDLIEARLALGEHAVLVPELESLVSEHPLRERMWAALMLALYRCDRQADALRAYQRVRTMLAEELGLEPSPELVDLERRILDHDQTLIASPPATVDAVLAHAEHGVGLPSPPTSFVGRQGQVDEVGGLVGGHRLVTLTGAGGCGKTRLAIEVARRLADEFSDGVRFADLAAVSDGTQVGDAVIRGFGLAQDPTRADPVPRLATYLADREMLGVLDNCEHVLDACAALAEAVVAQGGSSRLLASSREPLGIPGERVYVVPSLEVDTEAMHLFCERASEAGSGFAANDTDRATITQICRRLDGIPLAIELAAARMAHLSPVQLLERLDDRFALLTAQRSIPRHQTLEATLDWSYDLLDAREQDVLRSLAVFPASFTLEAAEAVAGVDDVVQTLGSLVAKSLVQIVDAGERLRYRLLETVRLYTQNRLDAHEAESCRARLRDSVLEWLESIPQEERWNGDPDPSWAAEDANVRVTLEYALANAQVEAAARIAVDTHWRLDEHWHEVMRWCEAVAEAGDTLSPDLQLQVCCMLGRLEGRVRRGPADWNRGAHWAERGIAAAMGKPSPRLASALGMRGISIAGQALERQDESLASRATEDAEACVAMSEGFDVPVRMACRLLAGITYSMLTFASPRYAEPAQRHYAAGVAVAEPSPPYLGLHAELCGQLAVHRFVAGDITAAAALARQAQRDIVRSRWFQLDTPLALAAIVTDASRGNTGALHTELCAYHDTAVRRDWGPGAIETIVLYGGILAAIRGHWELAARLLAAGAHGVYASPGTAHLSFHFHDRARAALDPGRARILWEEGRAMPLADAVAAALR